MKRGIFSVVILVSCLLLAPAAMGQEVMGGSAAPVAMAPGVAAMAVPVAAMATEPVTPAPSPVAAPEAAMAAPVAPAAPVVVVKEAVPTLEWKTAGFWISSVIIPVLLFVIGLLVALGVLKKKWLVWVRSKGIIAVADKVVNGFEAYAKGTPAKWDDVLAQALKAVVVRFGELAPEEVATVKALVKEREEQAAKKIKPV